MGLEATVYASQQQILYALRLSDFYVFARRYLSSNSKEIVSIAAIAALAAIAWRGAAVDCCHWDSRSDLNEW